MASIVSPRGGHTRLALYKIDGRSGLPIVSVLEILRHRKFVDLETAAHAIGVWPSSLRNWERGLKTPNAHSQAKIEEIFGRPWDELARVAPPLGLLGRRRKHHERN